MSESNVKIDYRAAGFERGLATLVSVLFHPVFVPLFCVLIIVPFNPYRFGAQGSAEFNFIFRTVILYTIFYPLITMGIMRLLKLIDSFKADTRKQRIAILIPTYVYFSWTFLVLTNAQNLDFLIGKIFVGVLFSTSVALILTILKNTISFHAMGVGGLLVVAIFGTFVSVYAYLLPLLCVVIVAGLVCTSRLLLQAHSKTEVLHGFLLGVFIMFFCIVTDFSWLL